MPQAIGMQMIMQIIQQVVQMLMKAIQKAMQEGQKQQQMQQTAQQTMEQNDITARDQQMSMLDQAEQESFNIGEFLMARVFAELKSDWPGGAGSDGGSQYA
jgi:hypothetical protein